LTKLRRWVLFSGISLLGLSAVTISRADDDPVAPAPPELAVDHAECVMFGAAREKAAAPNRHPLTSATEQVARVIEGLPRYRRPRTFERPPAAGSIDSYIYQDLQANGVTPAAQTTDYEFIRRVTLDLTGRIPKADRIARFVADTSPGKRAALIDELLARPEWVDKWTMYFGDLYKNTENRPSSGIRRFPQGRNAFYQWIYSSLQAGKPYNQMATELITAAGDSSYDTGQINYLVGAIVTGGPQQDVTDAMTTTILENFLGISHVNCLLCHNGRGHLDQLSLWGKGVTRYRAWQLASYLSHTQSARTPVTAGNNNIYYWSLRDDTRGFTTDYALNTLTGNRPARQPNVSPCRAGQPCYTVAPQYIFDGGSPKPGETYRAAFARSLTGDFQFARATVNYMWDQFFGRGIVDPPNQFDPARLDPDNPPPDPWSLQPSNARLLNTLAQHFIDSNYNLKALMKEIASSETYQMSSRYDGEWNPAWEKLFARKFVRRLWGEEVHDAVVQSSLTNTTYSIAGFSTAGFTFAPSIFAMQSPDVVNVPNAAVSVFLDSFLRGNRDDNERRADGAVQQALNLMNDNFIMSRIQVTGANANQLIVQNVTKGDDELINTLFLNILSRYPTEAEKTRAVAALKVGTRTQATQDLVWSLYNKVDFVFNY
jgi:hypothetical protein